MRRRFLVPLAGACLLTCAVLAAAPKGDAVAGKEKADAERCLECHGSASEGRGAKLTGQRAAYLRKQLDDFRSGARKHDVMQMMVRSVEPADLLDIVAYFASQPGMQGDGRGEHPAGRALYDQGDAARAIAPCGSCHGERGQGSAQPGPPVPLIGGQDLRYLEQQLLDWRHGLRKNSADGAMNRATRTLTDQEISALANYLAAQQPPP